MRASGRMLARSCRARQASSSAALMPRARRRSPSSPASSAAPSIASALVSSTRSPVRAERLSLSSARPTVPSAVSETTGLVDGVRDLGVAAGERDAGARRPRPPGRRSSASACDGVVPGGQQHRRQQPARLGAGGRDVVDVDEDGGAADVLAAERDRVAVRDEQLGAGEVEGGDVLADAGGDTTRAGSSPATPARNPASRSLGSLPRRQRQAEPDDVAPARRRRPTTKSQSAVVRRGRLAVAAAAP